MWRCVKYHAMRCGARIFTENEDTPEGRHEGNRNHAPDPVKVEARKMRQHLFEEAINSQAPSQAVAATALSEVPKIVLAEMPTLNSLTRSIRRIRENEEVAPPLPKNLEELIIPEEYQTMENGDKFLAFDSGPGLNRMLIFWTKNSVDWLSKGGVLLNDGTFNVAPNLFSQMYTLHAYEDGHSVPCVFALTAHRTAEVYTNILSYLKREKPATHRDS